MVHHSDLIEALIINTGSESTIFLFNKIEVCGCRRCGQANVPLGQGFGYVLVLVSRNERGYMCPLGGVVPSSRSVAQSQGWCGSSLEALDLLNTYLRSSEGVQKLTLFLGSGLST